MIRAISAGFSVVALLDRDFRDGYWFLVLACLYSWHVMPFFKLVYDISRVSRGDSLVDQARRIKTPITLDVILIVGSIAMLLGTMER